jgi:hypothetical protein
MTETNRLVGLAIEAMVLLAVSLAAGGATLAVARRKLSFPRGSSATIIAATAISFILSEVWTQLGYLPRYSRFTIAICVVLAVIAVMVQARRRGGVVRTQD